MNHCNNLIPHLIHSSKHASSFREVYSSSANALPTFSAAKTYCRLLFLNVSSHLAAWGGDHPTLMRLRLHLKVGRAPTRKSRCILSLSFRGFLSLFRISISLFYLISWNCISIVLHFSLTSILLFWDQLFTYIGFGLYLKSILRRWIDIKPYNTNVLLEVCIYTMLFWAIPDSFIVCIYTILDCS